jgi:hypothetical protein
MTVTVGPFAAWAAAGLHSATTAAHANTKLLDIRRTYPTCGIAVTAMTATATRRRGSRQNGWVLSIPRSDLLRRVLGSLRDHPHNDTVDQVAVLLRLPEDDVHVALTALAEDDLVRQTRSHWVLSRDGWASARADDPYDDFD